MEDSIYMDIQYSPEYNNPENAVHQQVLETVSIPIFSVPCPFFNHWMCAVGVILTWDTDIFDPTDWDQQQGEH